MPNQTYAGTTVETDAGGYMVDATMWTKPIGEEIARQIGLELTPRHWDVIEFARKDFAERGQSPGLRRITTNTDVNMKEIYKLFPKGPGKLVAMVSGIPKPKSCL